MTSIDDKFALLDTADAPGQEHRQAPTDFAGIMRGNALAGDPVDFSHGDVDAFSPPPEAFDSFAAGVALGGAQAGKTSD